MKSVIRSFEGCVCHALVKELEMTKNTAGVTVLTLYKKVMLTGEWK
ncbi:MAG: hypothetical protein HEP71_07705 [Roseivirga sp.]|nr:hypothetical protein [Roseivirga sp.]